MEEEEEEEEAQQLSLLYHQQHHPRVLLLTKHDHQIQLMALQEQQAVATGATVPAPASSAEKPPWNRNRNRRSSRSSPYRTQLQRESHILAERQRREEMNEKFTILRSMIPKLTKKDKASIVTDTINYIRELEKKVSYLQAACSSKQQQGVSLKKMDLMMKKKSSSSSMLSAHRGGGGSSAALDLPMLHVLHKAINNSSGANTTTAMTTTTATTTTMQAEAEDGDHTANASGLIPLDHHDGSWCCSGGRVKVGEVEIEEVGNDVAVIKVVSRRSRGLVLRLHVALRDCKVEVIQSNVTTLGDNMVHFVTIRLNVGISATLIDLATSLQLAISSSPDPVLGFGHGVVI